MSLFAYIIDNIVVNVIVAEQEVIDTFQDSECYIMYENEGVIKKNILASKGFIYDDVNDVFIASQPWPSWSLDDNYEWQAPIPKPEDNIHYTWDEENQSWVPSNEYYK